MVKVGWGFDNPMSAGGGEELTFFKAVRKGMPNHHHLAYPLPLLSNKFFKYTGQFPG